MKECPVCKTKFEGMGAISRVDNKTEICSDCGEREAMVGISRNDEKKVRIVVDMEASLAKALKIFTVTQDTTIKTAIESALVLYLADRLGILPSEIRDYPERFSKE